MKPTLSTNKYYKDYKQKLERELQKFNGKVQVGEGAETNSEATTLTKGTKKSGSQIAASPKRAGSPGYEDLDEAGNLMTGLDRDGAFDGGLKL